MQSCYKQESGVQAQDDSTHISHVDNIAEAKPQAHTGLGLRGCNWHTCRMTTTEQQLLGALKDMETAVAGMNSQPKPNLMAHFDRIDALTAGLSDGTDGELMHYLQKKSYEKARLFLEGRLSEIEKGGCLR